MKDEASMKKSRRTSRRDFTTVFFNIFSRIIHFYFIFEPEVYAIVRNIKERKFGGTRIEFLKKVQIAKIERENTPFRRLSGVLCCKYSRSMLIKH